MRIRHIKGAEEALEASPYVISEPVLYKGRWNEAIYGREAELWLEVGTGMGTFLRTLALREPEHNYLGLEINTTVLYKALNRYLEESGRDRERPEGGNLRFIRSDARFLGEFFAKGEVDRIFLNFSDPWPKDKNANKRLTSAVFLRLYDEILKEQGELEFKTDNENLFDYSLESIRAYGWIIKAQTRDLHQDEEMNRGNVMTEYEAKFSAKGNKIFKLIAAKG